MLIFINILILKFKIIIVYKFKKNRSDDLNNKTNYSIQKIDLYLYGIQSLKICKHIKCSQSLTCN